MKKKKKKTQKDRKRKKDICERNKRHISQQRERRSTSAAHKKKHRRKNGLRIKYELCVSLLSLIHSFPVSLRFFSMCFSSLAHSFVRLKLPFQHLNYEYTHFYRSKFRNLNHRIGQTETPSRVTLYMYTLCTNHALYSK